MPDAAGEKSLYIRPFMIATEMFLGVRPAQHVTFMVIASPAGAYFKGGVKPVTLWLTEEYTRAGRGGMGAAKTGGNYASSLVAQQEATAHGCDQVVFLDAQEGRYVEELGGMNMYFVYDDGHIVTPETGTILEGITRVQRSSSSPASSATRSRSASSPSTSGARASPAARSPRSSPAAPPPWSPRSARSSGTAARCPHRPRPT